MQGIGKQIWFIAKKKKINIISFVIENRGKMPWEEKKKEKKPFNSESGYI